MSKQQWLAENMKEGEVYAGILLGRDGAPDRHIFLLPGEKSNAKWADAMKWAASIGGELPTRLEQRILFANAQQHFEKAWYWSGEQHASGSDYAWGQDFGDGFQIIIRKSYEGRARAVRRLIIL